MKRKILYITCLLVLFISSSNLYSQTTYIRTVVHVMYTTPSEDIPNSTILGIINDVNKGFAKLTSPKFIRVPNIFGPDWANTNIQLCLADLDPASNPTNGITHTLISNKFAPVENPSSPSWNPSNYLNIYIVPVYNEPGFPSFVLGGWASTPTKPQMGATFNYVAVASNSIPYIPELLSHEIGHVFGLEHLDLDLFADTPKGIEPITPSTGYSTNCNSTLTNLNTSTLAQDGSHWGGVDPPDMVENFMGLTFCCQFMFTTNQANFMTNYINTHLSSWITTTCSTTTGLINFEAKALDLQIYPNPTSSNFSIIKKDNMGKCSIDIIDLNGKKCITKTNILYNTTIEIDYLPSGIYIIKIIDYQTKNVNYLRLAKN